MKMSRHIVAVVVLFMVGLSIAPSYATIVYDSGGFEAPTFTAGMPLEGQDGWQRTGTTSTSLAQMFVTASGSQAVQIIRTPGDDSRWGRLVGPLVPAPPEELISIQWDMNVSQTVLPEGSFGPFFGMESYSDVAGQLRLGTLGVDAATGELLYFDPDFGPFGGLNAVPGVLVPFGTWKPFELLLDYGSDTYSIFYDGILRLSGIDFESGPSTSFSDAPITAIAAGADPASQNAVGLAFFDNYVITAIPEPSAVLFGMLVCMCVGASAVVRRKLAGGAKVADE